MTQKLKCYFIRFNFTLTALYESTANLGHFIYSDVAKLECILLQFIHLFTNKSD